MKICIFQYMIQKVCSALWESFIGPLIAMAVVIGIPVALIIVIWGMLSETMKVAVVIMLAWAIPIFSLFQGIRYLFSLYREARGACNPCLAADAAWARELAERDGRIRNLTDDEKRRAFLDALPLEGD